jgi:DNA-binding NarL/FixJ family response regulator
VSARTDPLPRVLLGDLTPMVRLGLTQVLTADCAEVLDSDDVADAERLRPDVVVLAENGAHVRELCARLRAASPDSKVILWPRDEDRLEVLDPGRDAPRRVSAPLPNALLGELGCGDRTIERE